VPAMAVREPGRAAWTCTPCRLPEYHRQVSSHDFTAVAALVLDAVSNTVKLNTTEACCGSRR
jgi:hypothetical protein